MKKYQIYFIGMAFGICIGFCIAHLLFGITIDFTTLETQRYNRIGRVTCDSNSMGLTINCNDRLYERAVNKDEKLQIGAIYAYEDGNSSIVHRLIECEDENCSIAIFKGDNNMKGEKVLRENITHQIEKVEYG